MTAVIFILGLIIGSFLNVCIYRIPRHESISYPPSHCSKCKNRIKWYDLFPIISYIFLRGRCRNCGHNISIRYPLIELLTAVIFSSLYIEYGITLYFVKFLILTIFLIIIGVIDLDTTDVYFKTTLPGILVGVVFIAIEYFLGNSMLNYLIGGAVSFGVIALIIMTTHGMGWGDAEICLMAGLYLGIRLVPVMIFIAFVSGGIIGVLLIVAKIKSRKDMIPFGPFISGAAIFTILFGERLVNYYIQRF